MPPQYHIETWGCQMNVHDSEKLAGILEREGYVRAAGAPDADVILLNTCSIREKAQEKLYSELGRLRLLRAERPGQILGVCGCVAQQDGAGVFQRAPYVDFVVGPRAIDSIPEMLRRLQRTPDDRSRLVDTEYRLDSIQFPFDDIRRHGACATKAFVTIIEGCNHRCTYCIVPTTRGREIYRDLDDVLAEVRALAERGFVEIEFLGQTVNAYRDAAGRTLADLLRAASAISGLRRIRFTTSHPAQMTGRLIEAMAEGQPVVCPYLHLPVQSGSTKVLREMRRGYDRGEYVDVISELRRRIPYLALGTDVIVGYPTESEADFEETLSLLDDVQYDTVYSFTYSPRPGTRALDLGDPLPAAEKLERLHRLQALQKGIQEARYRRWVGSEVEVLVEGPSPRNPGKSTGRTPHDRIVNFAGAPEAGSLQRVRVLDSTAFSLHGQAV
jgi:tRNA-2-methylthio-N6-dimethylallyladenosine synthase